MKRIALRLGRAIQRRGLSSVLSAIAGALRSRGLGGTLHMARSEQPFIMAPSPGRASRPGWPPTLDDRRRAPADLFARWLRQIRAADSSPPVSGPPLVLVVVGDGSEDAAETVAALAAAAPEARVLRAPRPGAIGVLGVSAPEAMAVFLGPGDRLEPDFHQRLCAAAADGATEVLTFDLYREQGGEAEPLLLPGANPVLLEARDYVFSRAAIRVRALPEAATNVRDAVLDWCAGRDVASVRRGWRHLARPLVRAAIAPEALTQMQAAAMQRMTEPRPRPASPPASAVLCTKDNGHLTRQLVRSLLSLAPETLAEMVIVSNGSTNPYAIQTLADLRAAPRVRVIAIDEPFNFSRLSNAGVRETRGGGPLLFINDDIVPVSDGWLDVLRWRLDAPGVGAVGPLLLYPREQVQHAGMALRRLGGAGHLLRGARLPQDDYLAMAACEREVSCLTGAVLLVDRAAFEAVGGFDESLSIALQDVDLCLKLHRSGLRNVFEPRAVLLHMESASVADIVQQPAVAEARYREWRLFMDRWADLVRADPFGLWGFDAEDESLHRLRRP